MSAPRKPRPEAVLLNLAPARQADLFIYMEGEGEEKGHSYKDCIAWLAADAIVVGKEQLRKWRDWYYLRSLRQQSRDDAKTLLEAEAAEGETIPEEKIQRIGNQLFSLRAIKDQDPKAWFLTQRLVLLKEQIGLDREKIEIVTCEKFLAWFKDKKARDIAESNISTPDKIAQLRQTYFADIDKLEQAGEVKLPE
jgi:hypothetical protein